MTKAENALIAKAQAAYQRAFKGIDAHRSRQLYRLGIIGLLSTELESEYEYIEDKDDER
jgi:hypothetical protein